MALRNAFAELSIEATQLQVRDYLDQVETKLQAIRDRLDLGLALDGSTLAALETIQVGNFPASQAVTGPLTDAQLRAVAVPVSGTVAVAEPVTVDGAVAVTNPTADPETGLAKEATALRRYGGGKTPVVATVTASGDTTIHTPAAGKKIRLFWVSAINDPDETTTPLILVKLGALESYRAYAVAHWEIFEGAVDAPLVINLSSAASVAVTAHIEEI
jgi:hypothetical protein